MVVTSLTRDFCCLGAEMVVSRVRNFDRDMLGELVIYGKEGERRGRYELMY